MRKQTNCIRIRQFLSVTKVALSIVWLVLKIVELLNN